MGRRFRIVDVFSEAPLAGNQLAVVLDAEGLDDPTLQAVAREFNFSETTFVLPARAPGCDLRVRIFTPGTELQVAGHPTVGTTAVLRAEGRIGERATLELGVGPTPVEVAADGSTWMTQPEARFGPAQPDRAGVAAALGLALEAVRDDLPVEVVSIGNPFLMVPLVSVEALGRARVEASRWGPITDVSPMAGAYLFVDAGANVRTRMLATSLPSEDPATGSAAGPLGAYLGRYAGRPTFTVEQGVEIGRRSLIQVDASGPRPRVGGRSVILASGELDLP